MKVNQIIQIKNLNVSFKNNKILTDINLDFYSGEYIGIIGKNGAGKTTFIETILGLNKISSKSEIIIDNEFKKRIGCIFQDISYDAELSLKEIFVFYSKIMNITPDFSNFDKFGLSCLIKKKFRNLSGGEKQKFKLMLTLSLNPKILILDEISTSLDYQWRKEIINIVNEYKKNNPDCLIILISHDYKELKTICNKFLLVENHKVIEIQSLAAYFNEELDNV